MFRFSMTMAAAAMMLLAAPGEAQRSPDRQDSRYVETCLKNAPQPPRAAQAQPARGRQTQPRNVQNQRSNAHRTACAPLQVLRPAHRYVQSRARASKATLSPVVDTLVQ